METIAEKLAAFVSEAEYHLIPVAVRERAKAYVLDFLGVTLYGSIVLSSRKVAEVVCGFGGKQESTVFGWSGKFPCVNAALANGVASAAVEMDTAHPTSVVHCGGVVLPAALALGERENVNGKAFLTAVIVGYELVSRVGGAFLGTQYYEGFHPTGVCGVFGAAGAASKLLSLNKKETVHALGIAGTQAAGLEEWKADGSWIKRLHPGKACHSGILAGLLAQKGFTGPATIFEGENGFLKAFSYQRTWDASILTDGLGKTYLGFLTAFKPYASCRFTHTAVDLVLKILNAHDLEPDDIKEITVRVCETYYRTLFRPEERRYRPQTAVDAQFSLPYVVAAAMVRKRILPDEFSDQSIRDERILGLASKVKGIPDAEYEKSYPEKSSTAIVIETRDGREYRDFADTPSGSPVAARYQQHPELFNQEITQKFKNLLLLLPEYRDRADNLIQMVENLEDISDINELTALLRTVNV